MGIEHGPIQSPQRVRVATALFTTRKLAKGLEGRHIFGSSLNSKLRRPHPPRGMPSLCECFGRTEDARQDAYKADGPASDGLPSQISIPASAASAAADVHKDAVEQGATREAARQQRAEAADEPRSDDRARGRADVQDTAPKKKEKDSGGHEGCAAVGGAADSGVPTIVVINTGDEKEGERDGELDTEQVQPVIEESTTEQPGAGAAAAQVVEAGDLDGEDAEGNSAVLQDLGQQVIKECGAIGGAETAEGLAEFVGSLASGGAEGVVKVLENFGPVGPLFKCLGMFIHFVGQVKAARGEGQRLRLWGQIHSPVLSAECIALSHVLICILFRTGSVPAGTVPRRRRPFLSAEESERLTCCAFFLQRRH